MQELGGHDARGRLTRRLGACLALAALVAALGATPASAGGGAKRVHVRFSGLPFQPVDGLRYRGVTYGFSIGGTPSDDADFNSFGPGRLVFVQDPSIEGNALGTLTLRFHEPTSELRFGLARSCGCIIGNGVVVQLFDARGHHIARLRGSTAPVVLFSETHIDYQGVPVSRAVLTFGAADAAERFAFDNLVYLRSHRGGAEPTLAPAATGGTRWHLRQQR